MDRSLLVSLFFRYDLVFKQSVNTTWTYDVFFCKFWAILACRIVQWVCYLHFFQFWEVLLAFQGMASMTKSYVKNMMNVHAWNYFKRLWNALSKFVLAQIWHLISLPHLKYLISWIIVLHVSSLVSSFCCLFCFPGWWFWSHFWSFYQYYLVIVYLGFLSLW